MIDDTSYHDRALRAEADLREMTIRAQRFHKAWEKAERKLSSIRNKQPLLVETIAELLAELDHVDDWAGRGNYEELDDFEQSCVRDVAEAVLVSVSEILDT